MIFCLHPSSRLKNGETAPSRTKKHHCSSGPAILQNLTHTTHPGNVGEPCGQVRNLNARRWRAKRESDRRMVPSKPGNSGGGKAPDFWHAFEEGKDRGLAMSLETPEKIRSLQRKLILATRYRTALLERMSKRRRSRSSASTFCTTRSTAKTFSNTLTNSPRETAARRAWTGSHSHRSRRQGFKRGYPAYGRTCENNGTNHSQCDG